MGKLILLCYMGFAGISLRPFSKLGPSGLKQLKMAPGDLCEHEMYRDRIQLCILSGIAVFFFTPIALAQDPVDRDLFKHRKFIVDKENVRIIRELSRDSLTPESLITTRAGAEYIMVDPRQKPRQITDSALGTRYMEIVWSGDESAWIEFEKLGSRTGHIDKEWFYPDEDINGYVKPFDNDRVILRDVHRNPLVPLAPHAMVIVKKLDFTTRYYYIELFEPIEQDGHVYSEGIVFHNSLYIKDEPAPEMAGPFVTQTAPVADTAIKAFPSTLNLETDTPAGADGLVYSEIRKILTRYVQLVDQISKHYMILSGKNGSAPVFRVFQLKQLNGDPASSAPVEIQLISNSTSAIPLTESEAVLKQEIVRKLQEIYPSVDTISFVID